MASSIKLNYNDKAFASVVNYISGLYYKSFTIGNLRLQIILQFGV
jgi:hypothetical protein